MSATTVLSTLHGRARLVLQALLLVGVVVLACGLLPTGTASAAAPTVAQCNGTDNVGGEEVRCTVTVTNTLDLATGVGSSTVTVQECHGPAGAPICSAPTTTSFADVTTTVAQCNGSGGGGGGVVACDVQIANTLTGDATTSPATVNQCNGSGGGGGTEPTVVCSPVGSTTSATVTQCNESGNGGGGTLRVQCTVEPSTQTAALVVTVDQCNGSGNGGGATVTCRSSVTNDVQPAQVVVVSPSPSPSPVTEAAPSPSPTVSPSPSDTPAETIASPSPSPSPEVSVAPSPEPSPAAPVVVEPAPEPEPVLAEPVVEPTDEPVVEPVAAAPITGDSGDSVTGTTVTQTPLVVADSSGSIPVSAALPRTGVDVGGLAVLGALLTLVGGGFLLLVGRTPRPAGRHALTSR